MAQLAIRPRRTDNNPFPRSKPPLGFWKRPKSGYDIYLALRANGSFVSRTRHDSKWTQDTWHECSMEGWDVAVMRKLPTGALLSQADAFLVGLEWEHTTDPTRR